MAAVDFLRNPENVKKYLVDPSRIVLVGHSIGGLVVASAAAQDHKGLGAVRVWTVARGFVRNDALARRPGYVSALTARAI